MDLKSTKMMLILNDDAVEVNTLYRSSRKPVHNTLEQIEIFAERKCPVSAGATTSETLVKV